MITRLACQSVDLSAVRDHNATHWARPLNRFASNNCMLFEHFRWKSLNSSGPFSISAVHQDRYRVTDSQTKYDGFEKRIPGGGGFVDVEPERMALAKKCVARLWLHAPLGSGVLLAGNWFLTNHHVLPDEKTAKLAIAEFNYEQRPDGSTTSPDQYWFDPDAGFHTSPAVGGDDWTVVKLKGDANAQIGAWTLEAVSAQLNGIVSVIQHPDGLPKKVATDFVIEIVEVPFRRMRYRADTLPGSSGSPVFNQRWQMVGLHHISATSRNHQTGAAIECNEGISIGAILEGLKAKGVWPFRPGTGDFLLPDGSWEIERRASQDAFTYLPKLRITVAIKGGKQMGKSAIASRVKTLMEALQWQVIDIDLKHEFSDADYATGHGFLRRLAEKIVDQVHGDYAALALFDRDGTPTAFKAFLTSLKQTHHHLRLLLILDRIDAIAGTTCCSPVLSGLRNVHDAQNKLKDPWLRMLLIHTIPPKQTGVLGSVFDVAKVIEVMDFTEGELQKLAALYGLYDIDLKQFLEYLGGHPALSQIAFTTMHVEKCGLKQIITDARKDGGIFKHHLEKLLVEFREVPGVQKLAATFRALVQGYALDSQETFEMLIALGVVKGTYWEDAVVRSTLYKEWLAPRLPK